MFNIRNPNFPLVFCETFLQRLPHNPTTRAQGQIPGIEHNSSPYLFPEQWRVIPPGCHFQWQQVSFWNKDLVFNIRYSESQSFPLSFQDRSDLFQGAGVFEVSSLEHQEDQVH